MSGAGDIRKFARNARRAGAEIRTGKKHSKVYVGAQLVTVLPHGAKGTKHLEASARELRKAGVDVKR